MKTSLASAFAELCLSQIQEFLSLTMQYEWPQLPLLIMTPVPQTNKKGQTPVVLFHANVFTPACVV